MTGRAHEALRLLRRRTRAGATTWRTTALVAVVAAACGFAIAPDVIGETMRAGVKQPAGWPLEAAFTLSLVVAAFVVFRTFDALFRTAGARALQCHPVPGAAIVRDRAAVIADEAARASCVSVAFVAPALVRPGGDLTWFAIGFALVAPWLTAAVAAGVLAQAGSATADPRSGAARALDGFGEITGGVWHIAPGAAFAGSAMTLLALRLGFGELAAGDGVILRSAQVAIGAPLVVTVLLGASGARLWAQNAHRISARFVDAEVASADDRWIEASGRDFVDARDPSALIRAAAAVQLRRRHPVLLASAWGAAGLVAAMGWATGGAIPADAAAIGLVAWFTLGVAPGRRARGLTGFGPWGAARQLATGGVVDVARREAAASLVVRLAPALLAPAIAWGLAGAGWLASALAGAVTLWAATRHGLDRRLAIAPIVAAALPAFAVIAVGDPLVVPLVTSAVVCAVAIAVAPLTRFTAAETTP